MADTRVGANEIAEKDVVGRSTNFWGQFSENVAKQIFMACAFLIVLIMIGIFVYVSFNGLKLFVLDPEYASTFFSTTYWHPEPTGDEAPSYGSLGFALGSIITTLLATLIVAPLAFAMALFMTELCPRWLDAILRPLLEIFTGMPSVVIGFLALTVFVPWFSQIAAPFAPNAATGGFGWGAATIVLIIMIIPTVISVSIDALRAVPNSVREASLALGSTRWQMMKNAVIPAAAPGLATAVILGMGRAIGEAFAVAMVLKGGLARLPADLSFPAMFFQPNYNLTYAIIGTFIERTREETLAACMMLALLLLLISFVFIAIGRYFASRSVYQ